MVHRSGARGSVVSDENCKKPQAEASLLALEGLAVCKSRARASLSPRDSLSSFHVVGWCEETSEQTAIERESPHISTALHHSRNAIFMPVQKKGMYSRKQTLNHSTVLNCFSYRGLSYLLGLGSPRAYFGLPDISFKGDVQPNRATFCAHPRSPLLSSRRLDAHIDVTLPTQKRGSPCIKQPQAVWRLSRGCVPRSFRRMFCWRRVVEGTRCC
jgi:hypothetical protein